MPLGLELRERVIDELMEALLVSELVTLALDVPVADGVWQGLGLTELVWLDVALGLPADEPELLTDTDGVVLGLEVLVPDDVSVELKVMLGLAVREGTLLPVSLDVVLGVPD